MKKAEIAIFSICSAILLWTLLSLFDTNIHNTTDKKYETWNCFFMFFGETNDKSERVSSYYIYDIAEETAEPTKKPAKKKTKSKEVSENDILNLARIIQAENGGHEDDEALLLTGVVVLKRVKSKYYPGTIMGVVSQKGQYSTYADGKFWNEPSKRSMRIAKKILKTNIAERYPDNLVFQSEFRQGRSVYKKLGYEYFCLA